MARQVFGLASIATLDEGRVAEATQQRIRECAVDIDDRGEDGLGRKVTIEMTFTPEVSAGKVYDIKTEIQCSATVPKRKSAPYSTLIKREKGGAVFVINEASAENVQQGTLDEAKG